MVEQSVRASSATDVAEAGAPTTSRARTPDEAKLMFEPLFSSIRFRVGREHDVDARLRSTTAAGVSVHAFRYGSAALSAAVEPRADEVQVTLPAAGGLTLDAGGVRLTADGSRGLVLTTSSFEPGIPLWFHKPAKVVRGLFLRLPMPLLRDVVGDADVVFRPDLDRASPGVRSWMRIVRLLTDELDGARPLVRSPLSSSAFGQLVASALLEAQPNSFAAVDVPRRVAPAHLRRALAAMQEAPERPWKVAELADLAHCGPRALQLAFREEFGHGPLEHLRRIRLERVHADLLRLEPGRVTVAAIADSWGFSHLGRFAAVYRQTYGELPSVTLASG